MPIATIRTIDDQGIAYEWSTDSGAKRHEGRLEWAKVVRVIAFKRDLFAYDLICLQISSEDEVVVEFDEEDPNWEGLVRPLPTHLPGATAWGDWFREVAFPAFEDCERTLFLRETGEGGAP